MSHPLVLTPKYALALRLAMAAASFAMWAGCGGDPASTDTADTSTPFDTSLPDTSGPDTNPGVNNPPELERVGDRKVSVGKTLSITLAARDADEDPLTFSVFGNLPEGARFDKTAARFEWAPKEAGQVVFLTFVVSDGTDYDRETVRIEVIDGNTTSPPEFVDVGDQVVPVDTDYELKLVATDPDGDGLTYGHEGALPTGAALDSRSGVFRWRPDASFVGAPVRITFTVSDGTSSDTTSVRFIVDDGTASVPKPPVFVTIPPQTARIGVPLTFTLQATDPNGDAVTFGVQGSLPTGANLNGASFSYTAAQADLGRTFEVAFTATDGAFVAVMKVQISVSSGTTGPCTPDAFEPNDDIASAKPIAAGTTNANLCETETTYDTDVFAVNVAAGQALTATLRFDATLGDLDLAWVDASENLLAVSEGVTSVETLTWSAASQTTGYLVVFGYGLEPLKVAYTLEVSLATSTACIDDSFEDNDTPAQAKLLTAAAQAETQQICPSDADYWLFDTTCGQRVEVYLDILEAADLDLYLFDDATGQREPVASAITEDAFELIDHAPVRRPGRWLLEVSGYPFASARSPYDLFVDLSGGCQDDALNNATRQTARALATDGQSLSGLTVCCGDDWFALPLQAGAEVIVDLVVVSGSGSVGFVALAPDGTTQLASKTPSPNGGLVFFNATTTGTHYLKVSGEVGARYGLDWDVEAGASGCTFMSCPFGEVCDTSDGFCQSDLCFSDAACPAGYVCRETYCVNSCASNSQCRSSYTCKTLEGGNYCGVVGTTMTGGSCLDHSFCANNYGCLFPSRGGYCAERGCGSCDPGTKCSTVNGQSFCAKSCNTGADCRASEGYICSAEKTCLPQNP